MANSKSKKNSKHRKLVYIREKNYLRNGGKRNVYIYFDCDLPDELVDKIFESSASDFCRKYKMNFNMKVLVTDCHGTSFIDNQLVMKISFKKA